MLEKFQDYTASLQGLSDVVDMAVQTKADFLCPIWAPIKFILKVSDNHTRAIEQILLMLDTVSDAMGHVKLYEELKPDPDVSAALLRLFTGIVDYYIRSAQFFGRRTIRRVASLVGKPYKHEFAKMRDSIRDYTTELHRLVLEKEAIRASRARDEERRIRCYNTDAERQTVNSLIRYLLARSLPNIGNDGVEIIHNLLRDDRNPSIAQLWGLLQQVRHHAAEPCFYVLDGLDEALDKPQEIICPTIKFLEQCPSTKCLFLGRPQAFDNVPENVLQSNKHIRMDENSTGPDIEAFIDAGIAEIEVLDDPDLRTLASDTLKKNSQGMFLWGKLMIDDLHGSWTRSDVTEKLQNLPQGLEKAYERVFTRLKDRLRKNEIILLRNVLTFTVAARRPLTVDELTWAHALHTKFTTSSESPIQDFLLNNPEKSIFKVCGEFVTLYQNRVSLNHSSIKDFLTQDESGWDSKLDTDLRCFRIDLIEANALLGRLCFEYLDLQDHGFPVREPDTLLALRKLHPFVEYASYNFIFHATGSPVDLQNYTNRLMAFCSSSRVISWLDHLTFSWNENEFDWSLIERFGQFLEDFNRVVKPGEDIKAIFTAQLRIEMAERIATWGPDDERAAHLGLWVRILDLDISNLGGQPLDRRICEDIASALQGTEPVVYQEQGNITITKADHTTQLTVATEEALKLFQTIDIVDSQRQVMVLLGVFSRIRKMPLNPLHMLYRLLLEKSWALPVYAVLGISQFYYGLDKYDQSLEICRRVLPRVENSGRRTETLTYELMGRSLYHTDQYGESIKYLLRVTGGRENFPALNRDFLGASYANAGRAEEGIPLLEATLARDRKKYGDTHLSVLYSEYWIARMMSKSGSRQEALSRYRYIFTVATEHPDLKSASVFRWTINQLIEDLAILGHYREAITWYEENPKTLDNYAHFYLGMSYHECHVEDPRCLAPALDHLEQSYLVDMKDLGICNGNTLESLSWYVQALENAARYEEVLRYARTWAKGNREVYGNQHKWTINAMEFVAQAPDRLSQHEEAKHFQDDEESIEDYQTYVFEALSKLGRIGEARSFRQKTGRGLVESGSIERAYDFLERIAEEAEDRDAFEHAVECLEEAAGLERKHFNALAASPFRMRLSLCDLLVRIGWSEHALCLLKKIAKSVRKHYGSKHTESLRLRYFLGKAFYSTGRYTEALGCWRDIWRVMIELSLDKTYFGFDVQIRVAIALETLGRLEEALKTVEVALDLYEEVEELAAFDGWSGYCEMMGLAWMLRDNIPQRIRDSRKSFCLLWEPDSRENETLLVAF
ncbi:hypothetical protein SLS56_008077 [Neofusicoccum ribis]|uniref:Uncharacterized protein n=1 Tax=Neofusicoccum ribis TaxID=45134 RepID=A0ABR3SM13_9PEZI